MTRTGDPLKYLPQCDGGKRSDAGLAVVTGKLTQNCHDDEVNESYGTDFSGCRYQADYISIGCVGHDMENGNEHDDDDDDDDENVGHLECNATIPQNPLSPATSQMLMEFLHTCLNEPSHPTHPHQTDSSSVLSGPLVAANVIQSTITPGRGDDNNNNNNFQSDTGTCVASKSIQVQRTAMHPSPAAQKQLIDELQGLLNPVPFSRSQANNADHGTLPSSALIYQQTGQSTCVNWSGLQFYDSKPAFTEAKDTVFFRRELLDDLSKLTDPSYGAPDQHSQHPDTSVPATGRQPSRKNSPAFAGLNIPIDSVPGSANACDPEVIDLTSDERSESSQSHRNLRWIPIGDDDTLLKKRLRKSKRTRIAKQKTTSSACSSDAATPPINVSMRNIERVDAMKESAVRCLIPQLKDPTDLHAFMSTLVDSRFHELIARKINDIFMAAEGSTADITPEEVARIIIEDEVVINEIETLSPMIASLIYSSQQFRQICKRIKQPTVKDLIDHPLESRLQTLMRKRKWFVHQRLARDRRTEEETKFLDNELERHLLMNLEVAKKKAKREGKTKNTSGSETVDTESLIDSCKQSPIIVPDTDRTDISATVNSSATDLQSDYYDDDDDYYFGDTDSAYTALESSLTPPNQLLSDIQSGDQNGVGFADDDSMRESMEPTRPTNICDASKCPFLDTTDPPLPKRVHHRDQDSSNNLDWSFESEKDSSRMSAGTASDFTRTEPPSLPCCIGVLTELSGNAIDSRMLGSSSYVKCPFDVGVDRMSGKKEGSETVTGFFGHAVQYR